MWAQKIVLFFLMSLSLQYKKHNEFNFDLNFKSEKDFDRIFHDYERAFNKHDFNSYHRKKNLKENIEYIKKFNYHSKESDRHFEMGLNEFSDMSWKEFRDKYLMKNFTDDFFKSHHRHKSVMSKEFKNLLPKHHHKKNKFHYHFGRRL